uniref:Uncharacterized protein n=1 Tax=Cacopsylla melanoneura TaxID=428564 RepID=A0A8D9BR72_9HEMI
MERDVAEIRNIVERLELENYELTSENQDLSIGIVQLKEELLLSKRRNDEILRDLEKSNKTVEKLQQENDSFCEALEHKDDETEVMQKLYDKNERLNQYLIKFKKDLNANEKDKAKLCEHINDLNINIQEKDALLGRMEMEIVDLNDEISDLRNAIDELTEENENAREELEECHSNLEASRGEVDILMRKLRETASKMKETFKEHTKKLEMCIQHTEEAHYEEQQNSANLKDQLENCQENNRLLKLENIRLDDEIYALKKTIHSCSKNWERTQHELLAVQKEYERYKESIGELKDQVANNELPGSVCRTEVSERHAREKTGRRDPCIDSQRKCGQRPPNKKRPHRMPSPPLGLYDHRLREPR